MTITRKWWLFFAVAAAAGLSLWLRFGYPRFSIIHLEIRKPAAVEAARAYLRARGVDPAEYSQAVTFESDFWTDRYLQKTLKLQAAEEFIKLHAYEIFTWRVRFFKELRKEEFVVELSPRTGAVVALYHKIDDIEPREDPTEESARAIAEQFLRTQCGHDLAAFDFHEQKIKKYENRIDYSFSWEKRGVYVPWQQGGGGAKLLTKVTVSGREVREFYTLYLDVPEKFERYIEKQNILGQTLYTAHFLVFVMLVGCSVALVVKRREHAAVRRVKKWYLWLAAIFAAVNFSYLFNNLNLLFAQYPTSSTIPSYLVLFSVKMLTDIFFTAVMFLVPAIAGESLSREVYPGKPQLSFLQAISSSFLTRGVAGAIVLGYLFCVVLLGAQSLIFYFGQKYLGVWREWIKMAQYSSAFLPFLGVFSAAASASLTEETVFRMFGIPFTRKFLGRTWCAVVCTAFLWGFGHSEYPIYPVWFRGIEVGAVGVLFGMVYLRFGLITVLVAHYLFDCFWGIAPHVLSHTTPALFSQALFIFMLPLVWAGLAFILNRKGDERPIQIPLDPVQSYNIGVLIPFLELQKSRGMSRAQAREELLKNNWDLEMVEGALVKVYG